MAKKKISPDVINDIGEKIGGARKDIAVKTGPKPQRTDPADTRPGWAKRFIAAEKFGYDKKPTGKWTLLDTRRETRWGGHREASRMEFESQAAAERAIPLIAVSQKHYVRENYAKGADGKYDASKSTYEIWRKVSDKKQVKAVSEPFASREAALAHMAEKAESLLGTAKGYGEEILAKPEKVVRTGPQWRKGDIHPEAFVKEIGARGVEFGNWQGDRQQIVNHAYDAMRDLADITGVKPESLTLGNKLAIAFGARGNGGKRSARAHYEPTRAAINLTKESGAGTLAHEWWHAADHFLAQVDDPRLGEMSIAADGTKTLPHANNDSLIFGSHRVAGKGMTGQLSEPVKQAYKDLMDTMFHKSMEVSVDKAAYDARLEKSRTGLREEIARLREEIAKPAPYGKRNLAAATPAQLAKFDSAAEKILSSGIADLETKHSFNNRDVKLGARGSMAGRWSNPVLDELSNAYKEVRGLTGFDSQHGRGVMDTIRHRMSDVKVSLTLAEDAAKSATRTVMHATDFAKNARKLDEARTTPYWQSRHEMAARAFTSFIEDKIKAAGRESNYLSYGSDNWLYKAFDKALPFPEGAEREAINAKFEKLFSAMKEAEVVKAAAPTPANMLNAMTKASAESRQTVVTGQNGKPNPGWSDEARAASAEARSAGLQNTEKVHPGYAKQAERKPRPVAVGDNGAPPETQLKAAKRLEEVANRTIEEAQKVHDQPRLMNTARRARLGSGVMEDQQRKIANAKTALRIAEALRDGTASPELAKVQSLADVERLTNAHRQAMYANKAKRDQFRGSMIGVEPDATDIAHAKPSTFVRASISSSDLEVMKAALKGKGVAKDIKRLEGVLGRENSHVFTDAREIESITNVAKAVKGIKDSKNTSWAKYRWQVDNIQSTANRWLGEVRDYEASKRLGLTRPESLRGMLQAYADVRVNRSKENPVAAAERALIGTKIPGFFPTPQSLASRMADLADIKSGMTVLEPSAGTGRLADAVKQRGGKVETIEMASSLRDILAKKGHDIVGSDFNEMPIAQRYDRIVMNPPFEKGQDMAHVRRAYDMLKPGGKMVAVMGEGSFFRRDKTAEGFRTWLDEVGGQAEKLPEGTFKESNTGVNTRLVTITKAGTNPGWSDAARVASAEARAATAEPVVVKPMSAAMQRALETSQAKAAPATALSAPAPAVSRQDFMAQAEVKPHPEGGHLVRGPGTNGQWVRTSATGSTVAAKAIAFANHVAKASNKLGAVAMIAAPATAAMLAYDATSNQAKADGLTPTQQTTEALTAAAAAGTITAGIGYGIMKGAVALAKASPKLIGRALPGVGLGLMAYGAYQGGKSHGWKGAVLGLVGADGLLDVGKSSVAPPAPPAQRVQQFNTANATYGAMQDSKAPATLHGFQNPTNLVAALAAQGKELKPAGARR